MTCEMSTTDCTCNIAETICVPLNYLSHHCLKMLDVIPPVHKPWSSYSSFLRLEHPRYEDSLQHSSFMPHILQQTTDISMKSIAQVFAKSYNSLFSCFNLCIARSQAHKHSRVDMTWSLSHNKIYLHL